MVRTSQAGCTCWRWAVIQTWEQWAVMRAAPPSDHYSRLDLWVSAHSLHLFFFYSSVLCCSIARFATYKNAFVEFIKCVSPLFLSPHRNFRCLPSRSLSAAVFGEREWYWLMDRSTSSCQKAAAEYSLCWWKEACEYSVTNICLMWRFIRETSLSLWCELSTRNRILISPTIFPLEALQHHN